MAQSACPCTHQFEQHGTPFFAKETNMTLLLPARPVRPIRCTWTSGSRDNQLNTASRLSTSRPRAATSVATRIEMVLFENWTKAWSRSRCSMSPCSSITLKRWLFVSVTFLYFFLSVRTQPGVVIFGCDEVTASQSVITSSEPSICRSVVGCLLIIVRWFNLHHFLGYAWCSSKDLICLGKSHLKQQSLTFFWCCIDNRIQRVFEALSLACGPLPSNTSVNGPDVIAFF